MSFKRGLIAAAAAVAAVAGAANASIVHFSNGTQIFTSINGGSSFVQSGNVTSVNGNTPASGFGVVGLGYHSNSGTFYATGSNNVLYTVAGLGTANVSLTQYRTLGGDNPDTISFDFFGDTFRGVRGNVLISFDITNAGSTITTGSNLGRSFPSTANVGGTYFGISDDSSGVGFYNLDSNTRLGTTFSGNLTSAGGAALNGKYYTVAVRSGQNAVLFGEVNTLTGAFSQLSSTAITPAGQMGMVVVIPLPPAAMAGMASLAGLGGLAWVRRRSLRRA